MKEFKVNEYITVKLEGYETVIYIDGIAFMQCKRLVLNIPLKYVRLYDHVDSIDEASEVYDHYLYQHEIHEEINGQLNLTYQDNEISYETEFWAHCSNLQTWYEYEYDTRILKTDLAFPLLKKLTRAGDILAKKVFKEEIVKRIESGYKPVILYLVKEKYLNYLEDEELSSIFQDRDTQIVKFVFASSSDPDYDIKNAGLMLSKYLSEDLQHEYVSMIAKSKNFLKNRPYRLKSSEMKHVYRLFLLELLRAKNFEYVRKELIFRELRSYVIDTQRECVETVQILKENITEAFIEGNVEEISLLFKEDLLYVLTREELRFLISSPQCNFVKICMDVIKEKKNTFSLINNIVKIAMIAGDKTITNFVSEQIRKGIESPNDFSKFELSMFQEVKLFHLDSQNNTEDLLSDLSLELIAVLEERNLKIRGHFLQISLRLLGPDIIEPIFTLLIGKCNYFEEWDIKRFYSKVLINNLEIPQPLLKEKILNFINSKRLILPKHNFFLTEFGYNNLNREDYWSLFEYGEFVQLLENSLDGDFPAYPVASEDGVGDCNVVVVIELRRITGLYISGLGEYADIEPLMALPQCIKEIKSLKKLYVSGSGLQHLPDWIDQLINLTEISLGHNGLQSLPETIGNLEALEILDLGWYNTLHDLPKSIERLKNLKVLKLATVELYRVPETIGNLKSLTHLDLKQNKLTTIPSDIGDLHNLEYLDLSLNHSCFTLLDMFKNLKNLKVLKLGGLKFTEVPESIRHLTNLKELSLSYCTNLTEIPNWISELTNLEVLNVEGTHLKKIPESVKTLENLRDLNLTYNMISKIEGLERLTNLYHLRLGSNRIIEIEGLDCNTKIGSLDLHSNLITEIKGLDHLLDLYFLNLSRNSLSEIKGLENLSNLSTLILERNRFPSAIHSMFDLKNGGGGYPFHRGAPKRFIDYCRNNIIKEDEGSFDYVLVGDQKVFVWNNILDLQWLSISDIEQIQGLDELHDLEVLNLNNNDIVKVRGLELPSSLKVLNLNRNHITNIQDLGSCRNLEVLNLGHNKIDDLSAVASLVNLKELILNNCLISEIKGLENMRNLEMLDLSYNPQIAELKGFDNLRKLKTLKLADIRMLYNQIVDLGGLTNTGIVNRPQELVRYCQKRNKKK